MLDLEKLSTTTVESFKWNIMKKIVGSSTIATEKNFCNKEWISCFVQKTSQIQNRSDRIIVFP